MASQKTNKRRTVWIVLTILFALAAGISAGVFTWYWQSGHTKPEGGRTEVTTAAPTTATEIPTTQTTQPLPENPVDFATLQAQNPDICAWLYVPNTNIDYPVAQATDQSDDFYLDHNINKEYEFAGTIYSEKQNARDFTDRMTVLYGHNMLNGTMFRTLHDFEDEAFFNANPTFTVYTPGHILTYTIFAAYESDNRHILNNFDFSDDEVFASYIQQARSPRATAYNLRDDVEVGIGDRIVTLSTCVGYTHDLRYLVQGVLTDDQLTQ